MADKEIAAAPQANVKITHAVSNTTLVLLIIGGWFLLRKMK